MSELSQETWNNWNNYLYCILKKKEIITDGYRELSDYCQKNPEDVKEINRPDFDTSGAGRIIAVIEAFKHDIINSIITMAECCPPQILNGRLTVQGACKMRVRYQLFDILRGLRTDSPALYYAKQCALQSLKVKSEKPELDLTCVALVQKNRKWLDAVKQ